MRDEPRDRDAVRRLPQVTRLDSIGVRALLTAVGFLVAGVIGLVVFAARPTWGAALGTLAIFAMAVGSVWFSDVRLRRRQ